MGQPAVVELCVVLGVGGTLVVVEVVVGWAEVTGVVVPCVVRVEVTGAGLVPGVAGLVRTQDPSMQTPPCTKGP